IADRFLSQGQVAQIAGFAWIRLDISDFPTRHPYGLALWQTHIERILADWVGELSVPIYRGREVTGFTQDNAGVDVALSDGSSLRAKYLVGCDGGRSLIRKSAGIDFAGWDPTISCLIAEVEVAEEPKWGIRRDVKGLHGFSRSEKGPVRVMVTEPHVGLTTQPSLRDLSEALIAVYGTDYGIHSPTSISRFTDVTRQAVSYRNGRVLLAGDAAHIHPPMGGQGLQIGVQDAVNLGWKLAQVVKGTSPETLLDTYHAERHPVAARALRNTMAQTALLRCDDRVDALRDYASDFLRMDEPRKRLAAEMSGLDIHYDLAANRGEAHHGVGDEHHGRGEGHNGGSEGHNRGDGHHGSGEGHSGGGNELNDCSAAHPLLGRRMPDLDLVTAEGPLRVFTLLHHARPVLLNLVDPGTFDITPWADRVQLIDAKYGGEWELPAIGAVTAPAAVLIRPDGHVAWVADLAGVGNPGVRDAALGDLTGVRAGVGDAALGDLTGVRAGVGDLAQRGLTKALTTWFGPPAAA
ncbi:MAG TPA: FAD-dependent monooxygenase, partial [Terriglobales bacterium]